MPLYNRINTVSSVKIILIVFYVLITTCYSRCSYAVIEKYLKPASPGFYELSIKENNIKITPEIAEEIAAYLRDNRLIGITIGYWGTNVQFTANAPQIMFSALQTNHTLTNLNLCCNNRIGIEATQAVAAALQLYKGIM